MVRSSCSLLSLDVPLEVLEPIFPLSLELIEPTAQRHQRLGLEAKLPDPSILGRPLIVDDSGLEKGSQMSAHRRRADAGRCRQIAGTARAIAQYRYHLSSGRISQNGE
jgi:hypothetical protein